MTLDKGLIQQGVDFAKDSLFKGRLFSLLAAKKNMLWSEENIILFSLQKLPCKEHLHI